MLNFVVLPAVVIVLYITNTTNECQYYMYLNVLIRLSSCKEMRCNGELREGHCPYLCTLKNTKNCALNIIKVKRTPSKNAKHTYLCRMESRIEWYRSLGICSDVLGALLSQGCSNASCTVIRLLQINHFTLLQMMWTNVKVTKVVPPILYHIVPW